MKSHINILLSSLLCVLLLLSCHGNDDDRVVASVGEYTLLESDLSGLVPVGVEGVDSVELIKKYVNQWVEDMSVLTEACKVVDDDFEKELEHYHNQLRIRAYEQNQMEMLVDKDVSDIEIKSYYNNNISSYVLDNSVVKVSYVVLPNDCPQMDKISSLIQKGDLTEPDYAELVRWAESDATDYYMGRDVWMPFSQLQYLVPFHVSNEIQYLQGRVSDCIHDGKNVYWVHFHAIKLPGEYAPLDMVGNNIKSIILTQRKSLLLHQLRQKLVEQAQSKGLIEIVSNS
ncbi:MAG: peptidyl-prolyl cis-trans isomerase [Bacteroidales bacterium]|nr:peptidyl-prolyl cis-trans isomerase [Candidatus Colimorpha onthohippi]